MSAIVVNLRKEISASKEAYFSWEITWPESSSVTFKKGMLCLTDIDQDSDSDSAIFKYQLHSTESPAGSHIFEGLHVGDYYARLTIIGSDNSINVSELLTVTVYDLGAAVINTVTPLDSAFRITLNPYDSALLQGAHGQETAQVIETVNFVLFGRRTNANGFVAGSINLNIVRPYSLDNIYSLTADDEIQNSWQYEIACFYTDNKGVSGDISNTVVATPTNKPNVIEDVSAEYDYLNKRLIITYHNPDDIEEWTPKTVRATLTYGSTVQLYYFNSSSSDFTLTGEQLIFNESSVPALTADTDFTLTLAMESTLYGYSDLESAPITCIVPARFCSEPSTISNVQYNVGDNDFSVSFDKSTLSKYNVTVNMVITNVDNGQSVEYVNYVSGDIVPVVNGDKYTVNLQVFYTVNSDIEFGPSSEDLTYFDYNFIPHGQADAPSGLTVSYGDGTATLSWVTPEDFHGYILDHYEVYNGSSWINNSENTSYTASCNDGYTSGQAYSFKVRAVTVSYDTGFYNGLERTNGAESSSINVYPLRKPQAPTVDTQTPGDEKCDITFSDNSLYGGVKQHYNYTVSNAPSGTISSNSTSHTFNGLTNNVTSYISISVVTASGDNTQESDTVEFSTTPFEMPDVPTLSSHPYETSVELSWPANDPTTILGEGVEYDVEYKLLSGSVWDTSKSNVSSPLTISGLTSNSLYAFRIRSKIYNNENAITLYSEYNEITSRPFKYTNAPTMNLLAGNGTITVELAVPVAPNDNYYGPRMYYATVDTDPDVAPVILEQSSNTATLTFNVGNSGLVNLSKYKIVAWYDMTNTETNTEYLSNTVSNSVTPFDPAVAPPLSATPKDSKINLSWNDGNMYGLTITKYQVSSNSGSGWTDFADFDTALPNKTSSSVQNTNDYNIDISQTNSESKSYKIRAVILNAGNTYYSAESVPVTVTPFTTASAPLSVSYVSSSETITLNWSGPSNLGGLPLERYEVKKDSDDWITSSGGLSHVFTGLNNGTIYTFKVRAVTNNSVNEANLEYVSEIIGAPSSSQSARPYAAPTISLDAVVSSDSTLDLSWSQDLGGHPFDHYKIYYGGSSIDNITSTNLSRTISSLTNGTRYTCSVEVYVKDENDNAVSVLVSQNSNSMSNTPYVAAVAPQNVTSVPGDNHVTVSWDSLVGANLGGLPLERYEVAYKIKDAVSSLSWSPASSSLSHDFTGLYNGTEYSFYVRAVTTNVDYSSDPNMSTGEVIGAESSVNNIPYLPLGAPLIVDCVPGNKRALLSWSAPSLIGLTLDHYEVSGGVLSSPVNVGTSVSYEFSGLTNNTPYSFYVRAVATHTYAGTITGPDSEEVSKIPFVRPDTVTGLVCSAVNEVLTITFNNPSTSSVNNGLAQDYKYILNDGDYNSLVSGQNIDISSYGSTTISVYVYARIRNPNNDDNNTNSVYSYANQIDVVNANLESDIQNLTATPGDKQIILNWTNINHNSESTYAIVRIRDDGSQERLPNVTGTTTTTITTLDGSPLVNGTLYKFNVYASYDDMLQITTKSIGPPIIYSVSMSGSNFVTDIGLNGDSKVFITIFAISGESAEVIGPFEKTSQQNTIPCSLSSYLKYAVIASNSVGNDKFISE